LDQATPEVLEALFLQFCHQLQALLLAHQGLVDHEAQFFLVLL
jgi:hypothetical protein